MKIYELWSSGFQNVISDSPSPQSPQRHYHALRTKIEMSLTPKPNGLKFIQALIVISVKILWYVFCVSTNKTRRSFVLKNEKKLFPLPLGFTLEERFR